MTNKGYYCKECGNYNIKGKQLNCMHHTKELKKERNKRYRENKQIKEIDTIQKQIDRLKTDLKSKPKFVKS